MTQAALRLISCSDRCSLLRHSATPPRCGSRSTGELVGCSGPRAEIAVAFPTHSDTGALRTRADEPMALLRWLRWREVFARLGRREVAVAFDRPVLVVGSAEGE